MTILSLRHLADHRNLDWFFRWIDLYAMTYPLFLPAIANSCGTCGHNCERRSVALQLPLPYTGPVLTPDSSNATYSKPFL